jgi:phosphoglycerate dehydrogenase-like enzyme
MGDSSQLPESHLLITFPLASHLVDRIRTSLPFTTVSHYPSTYTPGTKHPKALWSHEPALIPAEIWSRTTVLLTMFIVPDSHSQTPNLHFIQGMSAGVEHLLSAPFFSTVSPTSITVATASGVHATNIAEYVLMQSLNAYHKQSILRSIQASARWNRTAYVPAASLAGSPELRGDTMGILGYGCIGRECARLAHAFGMRILAATSSGVKTAARGFTVPGTGDPEGFIPESWYRSSDAESLRAFLEAVDILVIACPLTSATRRLISGATILHLKKTAYIINIARGPIVDHDALYDALAEKRIAGAILDVTEPEPLPAGHRLWTEENCVVTPHVSGSGTMYEERCVDLLEVNVRRIGEGREVLNRVDLGRG